jgi:hypothetical protein
MTDAGAAVQRYIEALQRSYDLLGNAASKAATRSETFGKRFIDDVAAGHKEASELAQRLGGKPEQVAGAQAAIMAAALTAQARVLSFSQLLSDESASAGAETQELMTQLAEASRQCSEAGAELLRAWATSNPFADLAQQSMAAWTKATQK